MLLNYIKIAFRNIARHKVYSAINIMGLAIGMACAILLLLFVKDELCYDRHNSKYECIYVVKTHSILEGKEEDVPYSPLPMAKALKDEYPVIEESVRILSADKIYFIDQKRETIGEDNICYADPEIFKVFDHNFIYGSPDSALDSPNTIVLNESMAKKYFGNQDPVGKILSRKDGIDYLVKGVFEDLPHNSSQRYTALITSKNLSETIGAEQYAMMSGSFTLIMTNTYILLAENAELSSIMKDFKRFEEKYIPNDLISDHNYGFGFQPLADLYLHSEPWPNSPITVLQRVYILSALALFILIIACINYMNLATARSAGRAREVGVRKVLGADRSSLVRQFLCESIIITMAAMLIALVLIELSLPSFNNLVGKELSFSASGQMSLFSGLIIVTVFVGLVAGSYPAFVLSSFLPVKVLRGTSESGAGKEIFRKILVVSQYSISIIMIICTILLMKQMSHIRHMDLGFNKEGILFIIPRNEGQQKSIAIFKENLLKSSEILSVAKSNITPMMGYMKTLCKVEDISGEFIDKEVAFVNVDFNFIDLMGLKVLKGRAFNREMASDQTEAILVNETLVKEMGWADSAIGKRIMPRMGPYAKEVKVIGVLKDFHFRSLHNKIAPTVITLYENRNQDALMMPVLSIKISPTNTTKTMEYIKEKWLELNPMYPPEITSLEDVINSQYRTEEAASRIFICSAFLGIFISCLGLFGLSSFIAEKRTKEIGVRKVFGASAGSIVFSLSFKFLNLVLIAGIIACPVAYYAMDKWLENFAYKTEMSWWLFVSAACIALIIALATVSYHAIKAALTDPVKALRYE